MDIPDYQSLMLPVLRYAGQGPQRVPTLADNIADDFNLSAEARAELLPSGKQRILHNRIHWAKFYLSKAGLLVSPSRGVFEVSEAGKTLLAQKPEKLDTETLLLIPQFNAFYAGSANGTTSKTDAGTPDVPDNDDATPEELIEKAYLDLRAAL